jgi:hypothetical protein
MSRDFGAAKMQNAEIRVQNDSATANEKLKCKNQR